MCHPTLTTPQFRMSIFTLYDISSLQSEVCKHNNVHVVDDLQPYNDLLFKLLMDDLTARKNEIMESMKTQIRETQGKVDRVTVPIWSYVTRFYNMEAREYRDKMASMSYVDRQATHAADKAHNRMCHDNGWIWTFGVRSKLRYFEWDGADGGEYDYKWFLPPVPVDVIFRKTDLLQRLSRAFSPDTWIVRGNQDLVHQDKRCVVRKMQLYAVFYPSGIPQLYKLNALHAVAEKYPNSYIPHEVEESHEVAALVGPELETPGTPSTCSDEPPPLISCYDL